MDRQQARPSKRERIKSKLLHYIKNGVKGVLILSSLKVLRKLAKVLIKDKARK